MCIGRGAQMHAHLYSCAGLGGGRLTAAAGQVMLMAAYASYVVADYCALSGIMSLFFCGICTGRGAPD